MPPIINTIITTTYSGNYSAIERTFVEESEHTVIVVFSRDFYYMDSGLYDYTSKEYQINDGTTSGNSNYAKMADKYGQIFTTPQYTYNLSAINGTTIYNNNSVATSNDWTLSNSLSDYYYIDTNPDDANVSTVSFTFQSRIHLGQNNSIIASRLVGWVYVPINSVTFNMNYNVSNLVDNGAYMSIDNTGTVKFEEATFGYTNYIEELYGTSGLYMTYSNIFTRTTTLGVNTQNGNSSSQYVSSSTISIRPGDSPYGSGVFYAIVEYIAIGSLNNQEHYHIHDLGCYSNGELVCDDNLYHSVNHTTSGGEYLESDDESKYCFISSNSTIKYVNSSGSEVDVTWGDYIPNVSGTASNPKVIFTLTDFNSGLNIYKFARTFYDTKTTSMRTWYYVYDDVKNTTLIKIYEIGNDGITINVLYEKGVNTNSSDYREYDDHIKNYKLLNSVRDSSGSINTQIGTATLKLSSWSLEYAGYYTFFFNESLYDITYQIDNPQEGTEVVLYMSKYAYSSTGGRTSSQLVSVKTEGGKNYYAFGSGDYIELTTSPISDVIQPPSEPYSLITKVTANNKSLIVYTQIPSHYYMHSMITTNSLYRLTDTSISATNIKDLSTGKFTESKSTSYVEDNSSLIVNGVRPNGYLYYSYNIHDATNTLITKKYYYDYGKLTTVDEKLRIVVEYEKDYYTYFDQLGLPVEGKNTANPSSITVGATSISRDEYINQYVNFTLESGKNGLARASAYVINNPYKLGYLAYLINTDANIGGNLYKDLMYNITSNINMSDRFWDTINEFRGTLYGTSGSDQQLTGGLYNLNLSSGSNNKGFINTLDGATISDLIINGYTYGYSGGEYGRYFP